MRNDVITGPNSRAGTLTDLSRLDGCIDARRGRTLRNVSIAIGVGTGLLPLIGTSSILFITVHSIGKNPPFTTGHLPVDVVGRNRTDVHLDGLSTVVPSHALGSTHDSGARLTIITHVDRDNGTVTRSNSLSNGPVIVDTRRARIGIRVGRRVPWWGVVAMDFVAPRQWIRPFVGITQLVIMCRGRVHLALFVMWARVGGAAVARSASELSDAGLGDIRSTDAGVTSGGMPVTIDDARRSVSSGAVGRAPGTVCIASNGSVAPGNGLSGVPGVITGNDHTFV